MFKKFILVLLCFMLCLSMVACGGDYTASEPTGDAVSESTNGTDTAYVAVPLTDEEKSILDAMGSDVNVVTDETYVDTVAELMYHTHDYVGSVYQLEGVLSIVGEELNVSRTLVNGDVTESCGLPLRYLEKDITDGAWVRVTGVVAESEVNGEHVTVLDIVAIESLAEAGQVEIQWDGEPIHQH